MQIKPLNLPQLEARKRYRLQHFKSFAFEARQLHTAELGEELAVLHIDLTNGAALDIPARETALVQLMRALMKAYPQDAAEIIAEPRRFREQRIDA